MIHLDTREKPPVPQGLLDRVGPAEYSRHTLKAGDIAIFDADGHSLGIEHKRPLDWLASLGDVQKNGEKRIWNEIAKMKEWYDYSLIARSGSLRYDPVSHALSTSRHSTGWLSNAARMLEWKVAQETPIVTLDSVDEFLDWVAYLNKRANSGCVIPGLGIIKTNGKHLPT